MNTNQSDFKTYEIKGKQYARVSSVVRHAGLSDFSRIPAKDREWFMERGKQFHLATQLIEEGQGDRYDFDPVLNPYLAAHSLFLTQTGFRAIKGGIEKLVWSEKLKIAGRLDRLGMFGGHLSLLDYKLTQLPPAVRPDLPTPTQIQEAIYLLCLPFAFHEVKRFGVAFQKDGKYRMSDPYPLTDEAKALNYIRKFHQENP